MSDFDASAFLAQLDRARLAPEVVLEKKQAQAEALLERAQAEAPDLTGALIASGHIEQGESGPEVVFDAPHALVVHERVDLHHPIGGAKYLERSVLDLESEFSEQDQKTLNEALDG